ncbi:MAG: carboxymuconolactone decarboxylase family protein [Deltaproteobacteria bacterium]|nr:carboxymuconolactone decarboxylase family protein [Deltaproteobacteria bacterium]
MSRSKTPKWFDYVEQKHPKFVEALDQLGRSVREEGPLDSKTANLIQLAAAAAIRSEGAVHSHTKRALEAGAKQEEIIHAVILLTSTIGFPNVSAALSWIEDVVRKNG